MNFRDIRFPVFVLLDRKIEEYNNLIVVKIKNGEEVVLDNKNIPGDTLQKRRMKLSTREKSKKYFKKVLRTPQEIIKYGKRAQLIDSSGKLFKYIPRIYVPLKFYRAKYYLVNGKRYLFIEELNYYTQVSANITQEYAGILHTPIGCINYGVSNIKLKDTIRKI